jgi:hypothetical protein
VEQLSVRVGVQVEQLSVRVSELVMSLKEQAALTASLYQQVALRVQRPPPSTSRPPPARPHQGRPGLHHPRPGLTQGALTGRPGRTCAANGPCDVSKREEGAAPWDSSREQLLVWATRVWASRVWASRVWASRVWASRVWASSFIE